MASTKKAANPAQVATLGKAALTQQNIHKNNTIVHADSQPERMLAALQSGPVLSVDAVFQLEIMRPSSAVHQLRARGVSIRTELVLTTLPSGREMWCGLYCLDEFQKALS